MRFGAEPEGTAVATALDLTLPMLCTALLPTPPTHTHHTHIPSPLVDRPPPPFKNQDPDYCMLMGMVGGIRVGEAVDGFSLLQAFNRRLSPGSVPWRLRDLVDVMEAHPSIRVLRSSTGRTVSFRRVFAGKGEA